MSTDLIVRVVDFKKPTKDKPPKYIDREAFLNTTIRNEEFKKGLSENKYLGLLTHKGRAVADKEIQLPYLDSIITNPDLANVVKEFWYDEKDDCIYAGIDLMPDFDGGNKAKNALKANLPLGVSMSTVGSEVGNKYIISKFYGVDFTTSPLIEGACITDINFSEGDTSPKKMDFGCGILQNKLYSTNDRRFNNMNSSQEKKIQQVIDAVTNSDGNVTLQQAKQVADLVQVPVSQVLQVAKQQSAPQSESQNPVVQQMIQLVAQEQLVQHPIQVAKQIAEVTQQQLPQVLQQVMQQKQQVVQQGSFCDKKDFSNGRSTVAQMIARKHKNFSQQGQKPQVSQVADEPQVKDVQQVAQIDKLTEVVDDLSSQVKDLAQQVQVLVQSNTQVQEGKVLQSNFSTNRIGSRRSSANYLDSIKESQRRLYGKDFIS